jgi:hypothetical protein
MGIVAKKVFMKSIRTAAKAVKSKILLFITLFFLLWDYASSEKYGFLGGLPCCCSQFKRFVETASR